MHKTSNYIEAFTNLHTAKVKGHKAPHKAVLLLSIIDLVEEGEIFDPCIELTDELINKFNDIWLRYLGNSAIFTPDISKPYFHMQHEPFWSLIEKEETEHLMVAEDTPWGTKDKEKKELPSGRYSVNALRAKFAYAEIDKELFNLLVKEDARAMLRVILINTYLTNQPTKSMPDMTAIMTMSLSLIALVA